MTDETLRQKLALLVPNIKPKPWNAFFSVESFEKPLKMENAVVRASGNVRLYPVNYGILTSGCIAFATITSPVSAIAVALGLASAGAYKLDYKGISSKVDQRAFWSGLGVYAFLVVWLTNIFALVLFGLGLGAVACVLHAVLHDPPETFESS